MARFRELMSDGKIGDVRLGMLRENVEAHLEPPQDRSVQRSPAEILQFGSLELTFKLLRIQ